MFSKSFYEYIENFGAMVCGGGPRDLYLRLKPRDVDIFVPHKDTNLWFRLFRLIGFKQIRRHFYYKDMTIDVVSTKRKSPISIIKNFDCDICKWYMKNGIPTPLNSSVRKQTDNRVATFTRKKDLFGTCDVRINKFTNRGWLCIIK